MKMQRVSLRVNNTRRLTVTMVVLITVAPALVQGNGFYVDEQSVLHLGMAFSGTTTQGNDASATYYNPANLNQLSERQLTINLTPIVSQVDYVGDNLALGGEPAAPVPVAIQGQSADIDDTSLLPALYGSIPINDQLTYGIALNAPFNTETQYGTDSVVRYQSVTSSVQTIALTNSIAFQVSPAVSLGAGLVTQSMEAELVQAVNPAVVCLDGGEGSAACAGAGIELNGQPDVDGLVDLDGDDIGFGFNLGASFTMGLSHHVGFNYRSSIKHTLDGRALVTTPVSGDVVRGSIKARVSTPATTTLGYRYIQNQWSLLGEASFTQWSSFDELDFTSNDPNVQAFLVTQQFNWKNTRRFAIGAEYALNTRLTLRAGLALDKSPISDDGATVDLSQEDYQQLALGISFQSSDSLGFDVGYLYSQSDTRRFTHGDLQIPEQNLSSFSGTSDYQFHSLGAALRLQF